VSSSQSSSNSSRNRDQAKVNNQTDPERVVAVNATAELVDILVEDMKAIASVGLSGNAVELSEQVVPCSVIERAVTDAS
jgi:peptide deformylase